MINQSQYSVVGMLCLVFDSAVWREAEFDPVKMPAGLDDPKLFRTLTLHVERGMLKVIEKIFPGDKPAQKRARTSLRSYLAQQVSFDIRKLASWWVDGAHDEIQGPPKRRITLAQLWTSHELDCPELANVTQLLAVNLVPNQKYTCWYDRLKTLP